MPGFACGDQCPGNPPLTPRFELSLKGLYGAFHLWTWFLPDGAFPDIDGDGQGGDAVRELCCERGAAQHRSRGQGAAEPTRSKHDQRVRGLLLTTDQDGDGAVVFAVSWCRLYMATYSITKQALHRGNSRCGAQSAFATRGLVLPDGARRPAVAFVTHRELTGTWVQCRLETSGELT